MIRLRNKSHQPQNQSECREAPVEDVGPRQPSRRDYVHATSQSGIVLNVCMWGCAPIFGKPNQKGAVPLKAGIEQ